LLRQARFSVSNGVPYVFWAQSFNQQRLASLNLNLQAAPSGYSPAALSAALSATANPTGRTVYVGNLPATASVDELLNLVHFGPLESIRVLAEKSCVFLSFLDGATAAAFYADATVKKLSLHGQELKIGWGKPSPVPGQVALAISQSNASRNVYLGGLEESMTEEQLRDDLSRFGLIDQVKIVRDKNIGFVHFLSIATATKVCFIVVQNDLMISDRYYRLLQRFRLNLPGRANASTTARIVARTFQSLSRRLHNRLKLPPLSHLSHSLLARGDSRRSARTRHSLPWTLCRVWLDRKSSTEQYI
jgi:RNA recognition motif-containing protein